MDDDRINAALRDATDTQNVTIGAGVLTSVDDETGILAECVDELFAPGGFWARDAAP